MRKATREIANAVDDVSGWDLGLPFSSGVVPLHPRKRDTCRMLALSTRTHRSRPATRRGLAALAVTAMLVSGCSAAEDAMSATGVGDGDPSETTSAPETEAAPK